MVQFPPISQHLTDFDLMAQKGERAKRQHLVPRFYLDKFTDQNGFVWNYRLNAKPIGLTPENTAVVGNFYSPLNEEGERIDNIEETLSKIESNAKPLWGPLLRGEVLEGEDRFFMAMFVAAQFLRSPSSIRAGAEWMGHIVNHLRKRVIGDKQLAMKEFDEYEAREGEVLSPSKRAELIELMADPRNFNINILQHMGLQMFAGLESITDILYQMSWFVGRSNELAFITSDCPVIRTSDPETHDRLYGDGGFANKTVMVSIPLSPNHMLEMGWRGEETQGVVDLPMQQVKQRNVRQAKHAEHAIFADAKLEGLQRLSQKYLAERPISRVESITDPDAPDIIVKRKL